MGQGSCGADLVSVALRPGCQLTPSPGFNAIEIAFFKIKARLYTVAAPLFQQIAEQAVGRYGAPHRALPLH